MILNCFWQNLFSINSSPIKLIITRRTLNWNFSEILKLSTYSHSKIGMSISLKLTTSLWEARQILRLINNVWSVDRHSISKQIGSRRYHSIRYVISTFSQLFMSDRLQLLVKIFRNWSWIRLLSTNRCVQVMLNLLVNII